LATGAPALVWTPLGELTVLRRSSSWFKGAEKIRKDRRAEEGRGKGRRK